ncbi:hypothetical protein J6590_097744, partial [Homalodisca vitripennis]
MREGVNSRLIVYNAGLHKIAPHGLPRTAQMSQSKVQDYTRLLPTDCRAPPRCGWAVRLYYSVKCRTTQDCSPLTAAHRPDVGGNQSQIAAAAVYRLMAERIMANALFTRRSRKVGRLRIELNRSCVYCAVRARHSVCMGSLPEWAIASR